MGHRRAQDLRLEGRLCLVKQAVYLPLDAFARHMVLLNQKGVKETGEIIRYESASRQQAGSASRATFKTAACRCLRKVGPLHR